MNRREITALFHRHGIADAETEARLLLSHFGGISPSALYANPDFSLDTPAFTEAVSRRLAHEPLAYIIGYAPFCNETYRVTPDCLIPRFDTERLVELACERLPKDAHFADLCTGSGCVSISTLCRRADTTAEGYELSPAALALSIENAARNGVSSRVVYHAADLLRDPLPERRFDAILSNPPYIAENELAALSPEVQNEPRLALDGGRDGMLFYRRFLAAYEGALKAGGFFLFEIGYRQDADIGRLAEELGYTVTVHRDYGGNPRVAELYRAPCAAEQPTAP